MPDLIQDLMREIHRVEQLYPSFEGEALESVKRRVAYAQHGLAMNATRVMKESLLDLQDIIEKPKP
jgi:hypothetical protein